MNFELVQGTTRYQMDNEYLYVMPSEPISVWLMFKSGLAYEKWHAPTKTWCTSEVYLQLEPIDEPEASS